MHNNDLNDLNHYGAVSNWSTEDNIFFKYFIPKEGRYYHYTTQGGLIGIMSSLTFRVTDIRFFNDLTEVDHAYSVLGSIIKAKYEQIENTNLQGEVLLRIQSLITESVRPVRFVSCFTSKADDLNQWRSYASPGAGYSMGFDLNDLYELADSYGALVGRCIYGTFDLERIVDKLLTDALWQLDQYFPVRGRGSINEDLVEARSNRFVEYFARIAPLFKNGAFKEEEEIRVIFDAPEDSASIAFKNGDTAIVPYLEVSLRLADGEIVFPKTIHIKNTETPAITRLGVEQFLLTKGIDLYILENSNVPYREKI
jgi:hypothetical protein